jgi:hypothetical protein
MSRVNVEAVKSTRNAVRRQFYLLFIHSVVWRSVPFQWHTTELCMSSCGIKTKISKNETDNKRLYK